MSKGFVGPLLKKNRAELCIRNERNGRVIASQVIPAFDSQTRRTGLLKHESLPEGHAIVIAPTSAVHTWFMRFPIDIAFVTKAGRVVKVCHAVKPWRLAAAFRAYAVIELAAGALTRSGTVSGDTLVVEPAAMPHPVI
jgi:uncharacterized membrane protein (UPF0127 family)